MSQKFCNILECASLYHMGKAFQAGNMPAMVGSIVVVCVLTCYALLYSMCDLKATHIFEFKLGHNTTEVTKHLVKGEDSVDLYSKQMVKENLFWL